MPKPAPKLEIAGLFAALGEPTRLQLVDALSDGSAQSIAALASGLPISRQALTKHLKVLEAAGVTRSRREGRETVYRIDPGGLLAAEQWISAVSHQWDSLIDRLKTHVETPVSDYAGCWTLTSSVISAFSSFEIGQFRLASSASSRSRDSSIPGTSAESVKSERDTWKDSPSWSSLTRASVSSEPSLIPSRAKAKDRAMVKHPACDAAISSSGLVPGSFLKRVEKP